jgi:hypothetical protein
MGPRAGQRVLRFGDRVEIDSVETQAHEKTQIPCSAFSVMPFFVSSESEANLVLRRQYCPGSVLVAPRADSQRESVVH